MNTIQYMNDIIIIMAGGLGKRMNSTLPKVLHKVLDKPMLVHVVERALELNPIKIFIVVGKYIHAITETLYFYNMLEHVEFVNQPDAMGTGHAIQCCLPYIDGYKNCNVLILSGDVPLIKIDTLQEMLHNLKSVRIMTAIHDDPTGYGRVIEKNNCFDKIIEDKDCNEDELKCKKTNSGIYAFNTQILCKYLPYLRNNNTQNEYYLTDIIEIIKNEENITVEQYNIATDKHIEITGINSRKQLEELNRLLQS